MVVLRLIGATIGFAIIGYAVYMCNRIQQDHNAKIQEWKDNRPSQEEFDSKHDYRHARLQHDRQEPAPVSSRFFHPLVMGMAGAGILWISVISGSRFPHASGTSNRAPSSRSHATGSGLVAHTHMSTSSFGSSSSGSSGSTGNMGGMHN